MKSALPEDVEDEALGVANQSVIEGIIAIKCMQTICILNHASSLTSYTIRTFRFGWQP